MTRTEHHRAVRRTALAAICAAAAALCAPAANAGVALTWTGGTFADSVHAQTVGWSFTTSRTFKVETLDWYDPTGSNHIDHTVDLWTGAGSLLGTACVGFGCPSSSYSASDGYWKTGIDLSLPAGSYVIGGFVDIGDPFEYKTSSTTTVPGVVFGSGLYTLGGSTTLPSVACCGSIVGPNLDVSAVPEPMTWATMLLGFCGLGAAMRLRRRSVSQPV